MPLEDEKPREPPRPIYFDTAATTRVAPEVREAMFQVLADPMLFANPSSAEHGLGRQAAVVIDQARDAIATELACETDEVIFTSGATESINLALRGIALSHAEHGRHIVTSMIEHKATLACCAALERDGFSVTYLAPSTSGVVSPESIADALQPDTLLVSIMHTNNETGAMQPIEAIAALAAERGVLLHIDAAQAAGKFPISLTRTPIDLLSLSAHKFHGPKGIGCLAVRDRRRLRLQPLTYGGGQEFGLRPGTLPTHQILGLALALTLAAARRDEDLKHVTALRAQFVDAVTNKLGAIIHGDPDCASPYILNFAVPGIRSDALINQTAAEIAIASGSACSSGAFEPSPVLRAMGIEGDSLYGAVRISFDRSHTEDDIGTAVETITAAIHRMRMLQA